MSEEALAKDERTLDAVIHNFVVIGEATRHIPTTVREDHPAIPWQLMEGMRHILVHDYETVRIGILWKTIQDDIEPLVEPLSAILDASDEA